MRKCVIFIFLCLPLCVQAIDRTPWFGLDKVFYYTSFYAYQHYHNIDVGGTAVRRTSDDAFLGTSLQITPTPPWNIEAELVSSKTRQSSYALDYAALTVRYQLLDDVIGDPVSLVVGVSGILPTAHSWKDISLFHSGEYEYEAHAAIGKEVSCWNFWVSRIWGALAIGIANRGSPWNRLMIAWEHNFWDRHRYDLHGEFLWGWGREDLQLNNFQGYGAIRHRAVDLGVCYRYLWECWGATTALDYTVRVFAHNRPEFAQLATLSIIIPIPFQTLGSYIPYTYGKKSDECCNTK